VDSRKPGSNCDKPRCNAEVTGIPVQAHGEIYINNMISEYGWETVNEEGEWVNGKGKDGGWKTYSKRMWFNLPGKGLYSQEEIKLMFPH
jgi:hypothetical protein